MISSRRRDQIPDPDAEATSVSSSTPVIKSPRRPQRSDVFTPDPPPLTTTAAQQLENEDAVALPELRPVGSAAAVAPPGVLLARWGGGGNDEVR